MTLMEMLIEAGVPKDQIHNHRSDLYVPMTLKASEVIDKWCKAQGYGREVFCSTFTDQVTGNKMFEVAFAYDPYWENPEAYKE